VLIDSTGTIDEVTTQVFPDPASRPHYLAAIINHGAYATAPFSSVHAGIASMFVGPVLSAGLPERDSSTESQTPLLTSLILQCPELRATSVSAEELLHIQLTKLAVNAVINPLSALLDCINGYIFESSTIRTLVDQLIDEISAVELAILASRDSIELDKETKTKFSADALRTHIYAVGVQVAKNISSMRQDMIAGRKTEIDYINGYLVSQGTTLGVPTPINEKIVQLVKDRRKITEDEAGEFFVPEMWSAVEFGVNSVAKHLD
jgi:2-dehydropantoate 2-reductase